MFWWWRAGRQIDSYKHVLYINVTKSYAFLVWKLNSSWRCLLINMYHRTSLSTHCNCHVPFPRAVRHFLHTAGATSPHTSTLLHRPPLSVPWWGIIIRPQPLNVHRQTATHHFSSSERSQTKTSHSALATGGGMSDDKVRCWRRATSKAYVPSSQPCYFLSVSKTNIIFEQLLRKLPSPEGWTKTYRKTSKVHQQAPNPI